MDELYKDITRRIQKDDEAFFNEITKPEKKPQEDIIDDIAGFIITNAAIHDVLDNE